MSRRRADTRRNTLTGYLGRAYRFRRDIVLKETGSRPLKIGRRVTQVNDGDLTRQRAVRAGVERRGDAVTIIRIRVRHHHSPPLCGLSPRFAIDLVLLPIHLRQIRTAGNSTLRRSIRLRCHPVLSSSARNPARANHDRRHARSSFSRWNSRHRATDSRSHLPMSAEPFLVSERVAENVHAHLSKYTTRAAGQFRIVGRLQRASCAARSAMFEFSTARLPTC